MIKYRVTFIYGKWHLWADIERYKIKEGDRIGFANIAQLAVNTTLKTLAVLKEEDKNHIAHDFEIFEIKETSCNGISAAKVVYSFDTLMNE